LKLTPSEKPPKRASTLRPRSTRLSSQSLPSGDIPAHWGMRAFSNVGLRIQKSVAGCLLARSPVGLLLPKVESGLLSQVAAIPAPHYVDRNKRLFGGIPAYWTPSGTESLWSVDRANACP